MRYRTLGRSGVQVSAVGLGGNTFGNPVDAAGVAAIVDRALELGLNFVDTAESYSNGVSEEHLGKALAGRRHEMVVATKVGAPNTPGLEAGGRLTRRHMIGRLEASLRRLGTDFVDIYYFHFADPLTPLEESLRAADELIRSGKVRYLGISNHPAWQLAEAVGIARHDHLVPPVVSQVPYSLLDRAVEKEMLPACAHLGISVVPYSPLAGGFLTGKYRRGAEPPANTRIGRVQRLRDARLTDENFDRVERYASFAGARGHTVGELAIAWLLSRPVVCSVIAGATSPAQVEANARAADWELAPAEVAELD